MVKEKFNKTFFPHDDKPGHFKALDGLRGIAVLFVLLSHSSNADMFFHEALNFKSIGKIGVYLFFVLSAYLLDRQIAIAFMSNKSSVAYWKNYFLRRFLRIYPLFVLSLILHGLLTFIGIQTVINGIHDITLHMSLMKGESIFWSIPIEFKYYFISPLIMWFCHKVLKWDKIKLISVFLFSIVLLTMLELGLGFALDSTLKYLPIFLIGTFISIYELIAKQEALHRIKPKTFNLLGILAFILILMTIPYYFEKLFGLEIDIHSSTLFLPYAVLWGIILLAAKYGKGFVKTFLEFKILRFIGTISYSVYLFHMLLINFVQLADIPPFLQIYLFFFLTILFSSLSFILIERPLSKIRIRT